MAGRRAIVPGVLLAAWLSACGGGGEGQGQPDAGPEAAAEVADVLPDELPVVPDVPEVMPEVADKGSPPETVETADAAETKDVGPCGGSCPPGFCDEELGVCLYCDDKVPCLVPGYWCKEGTCIKTLCVPGTKDCLPSGEAVECDENGETWIVTTCGDGQACAVGQCRDVICTPGESHCEKGLVVKCDPKGVGWMKYSCPPGQGCFHDKCEPIRHNLLVVFDTSGSMSAMTALDAVPCICASCPSKPFPQCEDPNCPRSKLGMSKYVFNKFFQAEKIGTVNIVLTHFAMRIKHPPVLNCNDMFSFGRGWYGIDMASSDWITGDDGSHVTSEGGWFDQYLYEILSVPFPVSWEEENLDDLKLWVNFNEEVGPTGSPCTGKKDCPGGFCAFDQGQGGSVCWYHTDPELRALSGTPLGKSMFYAGEVYRKQMVPNGKACTADSDCKNRNYYCSKDGKCKDPHAPCRSNMILLFTDGVEEPPTTTAEFFNPMVQAKRYRYGLGCAGNADCFDGATCQGGLCQGYPQPNGGGGQVPPNAQTPWRLLDYQGDPILVTTHVIDLSQGEGAAANKQTADCGGGTYYHAGELDPDELLDQMIKLLDIKQNLLDCVPDFDG